MSGSLTKVQFVNPHGSMTIAVKNADGTTHRLGVYAGLRHHPRGARNRQDGPNRSRPATRSPSKFIPARNGSPLGFLKSVTHAGRREIQDLGRQRQRLEAGDHHGLSTRRSDKRRARNRASRSARRRQRPVRQAQFGGGPAALYTRARTPRTCGRCSSTGRGTWACCGASTSTS